MKFHYLLQSECRYTLPLHRWGLALVVAGMVAMAPAAWAVEPTPEQLRMLQQLTPEQRAALIQQAVGGTDKPKPVEVSSPVTVQPREVGGGRLEYEIKTPMLDVKQAGAEVAPSPKTDVSVTEVGSQQAAEQVEVRRAFEAFVRESKPMMVSTESLQQFGYELFAGQPSSFAPVTDIPVPPEYVLGPGDEIKVQLFGKDARELALTVDREGTIAFPQIGPVSLAGMSFAQAKAMLSEQINQKMIGVSASITMGQLRSIRIFALGDVFRPGSYTVSGLATLSHALFASGGVKKVGSLRNIELKRNGRRVGTIDLYDFLLKGDTSRDVRLLPGDVVFVPPIGKTAAIAGEVIRPAIYELKGEQTVGDMLKLAGGLLPKAYTSKALIERFNPRGDKQVVNIGLTDAGLATSVQNGDVIKVFPATEFESNQILLIGNVKRPGKYAWHEGMRVMDLLPSRDDLLPESLLDYGIIEREAEDTREPVLMRFRLGELLEKGGKAADLNVSLEPRDRIYVFQRANFRQQPRVSIAGSVQTPGQYEFKRNMRVADLVLAAGGLLRDTDNGEIEVYRTDPATHDVNLLKVNLARAMSGEKGDDIALQDLDRVVVHSIYERKLREEVSVMGEIHHPGSVPLAQGMRVSDLVFAGGNVTQMAYLGRAEITRYKVVNGQRRWSNHIEIDLNAALRGEEGSNILLEPYDVLMVRRLSNWRNAEQVQVVGEVMHPGAYPIEEGEHLSSLLRRVGGFTGDAYLPAAVFTRESVREEQQKQLNDLVQRMESEVAQMEQPVAALRDETLRAHQQNGLDVAKRMLVQLKSVRATGRMVIELADAARLKGKPYDLRLRAGDRLIVPKRPDEVLVLGEVYNQNALLYNPNMNRGDYVSQAGPTRMADPDAIYIVRANGQVEAGNGSWWMPGGSGINPGDTIVVPQDLDHVNLLDVALDWSRAMMQIGTSVAAMKAIGVFK